MDELLTARQVATLLGVSTATVLRWTREDKLPGFRLPSGAIRYNADAIQQWVDDRAT